MHRVHPKRRRYVIHYVSVALKIKRSVINVERYRETWRSRGIDTSDRCFRRAQLEMYYVNAITAHLRRAIVSRSSREWSTADHHRYSLERDGDARWGIRRSSFDWLSYCPELLLVLERISTIRTSNCRDSRYARVLEASFAILEFKRQTPVSLLRLVPFTAWKVEPEGTPHRVIP